MLFAYTTEKYLNESYQEKEEYSKTKEKIKLLDWLKMLYGFKNCENWENHTPMTHFPPSLNTTRSLHALLNPRFHLHWRPSMVDCMSMHLRFASFRRPIRPRKEGKSTVTRMTSQTTSPHCLQRRTWRQPLVLPVIGHGSNKKLHFQNSSKKYPEI